MMMRILSVMYIILIVSSCINFASCSKKDEGIEFILSKISLSDKNYLKQLEKDDSASELYKQINLDMLQTSPTLYYPIIKQAAQHSRARFINLDNSWNVRPYIAYFACDAIYSTINKEASYDLRLENSRILLAISHQLISPEGTRKNANLDPWGTECLYMYFDALINNFEEEELNRIGYSEKRLQFLKNQIQEIAHDLEESGGKK